MDAHAHSPLAVADEVFAALTRPPAPLAVDAAEVGLGPAGTLVGLWELRDLLRLPGTPNTVKNRCWRVLVARAQARGGAWTVGAVGVALGPLVAAATELANDGALARPDLDAEVLAGFLAALAVADPTADGLFCQLMRAARQAGLAWVRHLRAADTPLRDVDDHASTAPSWPWGHPDLVLSDAVEAGVITTAEAELIGTTRLDGVRLAEIATRDRVSVTAVKMRRLRAEHRLVTALRAAWSTDQDRAQDPTSAHALDATGLASRVTITRALRAPRHRGNRGAPADQHGHHDRATHPHASTHNTSTDTPSTGSGNKVGGDSGVSAPCSQQEEPRPLAPPAHPAHPGARRREPKAA